MKTSINEESGKSWIYEIKNEKRKQSNKYEIKWRKRQKQSLAQGVISLASKGFSLGKAQQTPFFPNIEKSVCFCVNWVMSVHYLNIRITILTIKISQKSSTTKDTHNQDANKFAANIIDHERCTQPRCKDAHNQDTTMPASFDCSWLLQNHLGNSKFSKDEKIYATKMQRYTQPRCKDTCITNTIPNHQNCSKHHHLWTLNKSPRPWALDHSLIAWPQFAHEPMIIASWLFP